MISDTPNTPDSNDQETGQLSNQPAEPAGRKPKEMAYVGISATELEEIGAETYHGTADAYQRNDIQDFKDAIVANENMTAAGPVLFEEGTDQRGETNDVQQRAEDGDSNAVEHPEDNPGLGDAGDPATPADAYENQSNKPKAEQQHGSGTGELPDEPGTTPDSNNSQQKAKLG